MWARGELNIGQDFVHESIVGSTFVGRLEVYLFCVIEAYSQLNGLSNQFQEKYDCIILYV